MGGRCEWNDCGEGVWLNGGGGVPAAKTIPWVLS